MKHASVFTIHCDYSFHLWSVSFSMFLWYLFFISLFLWSIIFPNDSALISALSLSPSLICFVYSWLAILFSVLPANVCHSFVFCLFVVSTPIAILFLSFLLLPFSICDLIFLPRRVSVSVLPFCLDAQSFELECVFALVYFCWVLFSTRDDLFYIFWPNVWLVFVL